MEISGRCNRRFLKIAGKAAFLTEIKGKQVNHGIVAFGNLRHFQCEIHRFFVFLKKAVHNFTVGGKLRGGKRYRSFRQLFINIYPRMRRFL